MFIKAKTLTGFQLYGLDGIIGKVREFYFDDKHWVVRYLVADTGNWLTGRQVLISPHSLGGVMKENAQIAVTLTMKMVENSPHLDSDKPVSRQFEESYYGFYGWPTYWNGPYMWGPYPHLLHERETGKEPHVTEPSWDPHLRSMSDVAGHNIQATDGEIGHVDDFIIDDETWAIRYLVIATQNWWPGKKVIVSPQWISRVSWSESKVFVNLMRDTIRRSPEYSEELLVTREYESDLYRHYKRPEYWSDKPAAKRAAQKAAGRVAEL